MSVRVFAPAKINLTLEVGRPQADGYHPLRSAVMFADLGDWIEALPADGLSLEVGGPFATALKADDSNLVLRAARLLDSTRGAALKLEKILPVASGIGGGSSDAASALKALNELWSMGRSESELAQISKPLGADVPVCVIRRAAWMTGTGHTLIWMVEAPNLHAVLANPGVPLQTSVVYGRFDELGLGRKISADPLPQWRTPEQVWNAVIDQGNDLEEAAVSLLPQLGGLLAGLRADPRAVCAGLSGSGATCFALTRDAPDASALAQELTARNPHWWVRATTLGAP